MTGFKDFSDGNYFTAAEVDGYLMRQTAMRFPTTANLVAELGSTKEPGSIAWAADTAVYYMWDGTNWVPWFSGEKTTSVPFTAGGTNITVGNSTVVTKWRYSGGMVKFDWTFTIGSTANMQAGNLAMGLPVPAHVDHIYYPSGTLSFWDTSASVMKTFSAVNLGTQGSIGFVLEAGTRLSTSISPAFAVGDVLSVNCLYRPTSAVLL